MLLIKASFNVRTFLPFGIMPELRVRQTVCVRGWLGGDNDVLVTGADNDNDEDIWSWDNFRRGKKIRELFGANLPDIFPVISGFGSGEALMVKSLDLFDKSYDSSDKLYDKITGYIKEMSTYKGQSKPWGKDGIVITPEEIRVRRIILVIPENKMAEWAEATLERCSAASVLKGVILDIRRYGMKK